MWIWRVYLLGRFSWDRIELGFVATAPGQLPQFKRGMATACCDLVEKLV